MAYYQIPASPWRALSLLLGLLLAGSPRAEAQQAPRLATRVDSLRVARDGTPDYLPAQFTFVNGKQVRGYVREYRSVLFDYVECYERPPDQMPPPKMKSLSIDRLQRMSVDGHTLDALVARRKALKILAENVTPGAPLQVYGYAVTKANMYIPIPLPGLGLLIMIPTGYHDKQFWYVRRVGGPLVEVPRGDAEFATVMAELLADAPEVAARVRQREPGTTFAYMPALIDEYNQYFKVKK